MLNLDGKTALVTGAGSGVGQGIVRQLARQGATVVVNDLDQAKADSTVAELTSAGFQASTAVFDVTDAGAVRASIAELGPIDILINNVGNAGAVPMEMAAFKDSLPENWPKFVDVNLYGVMHCTHAVLDGMTTRGWGRVITISSAAGRMGLNIGVSIYGAAKAGAANLMRHISQEVAANGVTCNAVALGLMDTVPEEFTAHAIKGIPCGRLGTPADAGYIVGFLASEEASWITGQLFGVDGGSAPF